MISLEIEDLGLSDRLGLNPAPPGQTRGPWPVEVLDFPSPSLSNRQGFNPLPVSQMLLGEYIIPE